MENRTNEKRYVGRGGIKLQAALEAFSSIEEALPKDDA